MADKTPTQLNKEFINELRNAESKGDPLYGATIEHVQQFDNGTEFIQDFDTKPPEAGNPYIENPLNVYDTYSYNVAIFMVHPRNADLYQINEQTVLMADNSQDPRYNVSSVEQTFRVGHSQVRSTFGNRFSIRISEPNGTTFLEKIALAARSLEIENHLHAKYYITVEFNGRLPNGKARKDPNKFIYCVTFQNIQMQVNAGGAEYTIDAVENHTSAFNYLEQVVRSQITVEAATVGEFIAVFLQKWDKSLENELMFNVNAAYKDIYAIEFDQESGTDTWLQWRIQQAADNLKTTGPAKVGDKIHFTIPNGSNLSDIIGMALQSTEEYKKILSDSDGYMKPGPGDPSELKLDEFPVFYKIIPKLTYGQFDPLRGDYVRTVTFKVKKHIIADRILDSMQYTTSITDSTIQKTRVNKMFTKNLLRKRYDYLFTGLNTEILNLDLKFDNQYYEISVIGNGQVGDANKDAATAGQSPATVHDGIEASKRRIVEISNKIRRLQRNISGDTSQVDRGLLRGVEQQIEELEEQRSEVQAELDTQLAFFAELSTGSTTAPANGAFLTPEEASDNISMRLRFAGDIVDDSDIYGPENDLTGGTLQFGAVKSNLENSADMMKIEMHVRGDPYWMGMPNSFLRDTIGSTTTGLADYEQGGLNFFLNVKFPVSENRSGRRVPRDDYTLSGVYRVMSVINKFESGQFTQYLEAVRDLATNTATVLGELQNPKVVGLDAFGGSGATVLPDLVAVDVATIQENGGT